MSKKLPEGWKRVRLEKYIEETKIRNKENLDIPVLSVTNKAGFIYSEEFFSKQVYSKELNNYKIVSRNELAYNPSRINVGSIDVLNICDRGLISPLYIIFRTSNEINPKYLLYYLKGEEGLFYINSKTTGSVRNVLSFKTLQSIEINIPSLEEQERIVSILEKAENAIQKREESIKLLDEYLKSVFVDMFGDPVTNPKGWEKVKVIDVCDCMVPGRDKPKSFTGDIPWITIDDLIQNGITYESKKGIGLTNEEIEQVNRKVIPKGSVIMSCVGNLGLTSIAGKEMIINQQLHSFQCKEKVDNRFLSYILPFYKVYMEKMATSTTVLYMNKTTCNSIQIILPPIELQRKFGDVVQMIEGICIKQDENKKELKNNFNALIQKAFNGEL